MAQNLRTTRTSTYNKPVYFDPSDDDAFAHPQLSYALDPQVPGKLNLGPVEISEKTTFFEFKTWNQLIGSSIQDNPGEQKSLYLAWPKDLFLFGKIEIISSGGRVVWKQNFSPRSMIDFQKLMDEKVAANPLLKASKIIPSLRFKVDGLDKEAFFRDNPAFKICISQTKKDLYSRLCSRTLRTRSDTGSVILGKIIPDGQARVMVNNKPAPQAGQANVTFKTDVSFYGRISSGETYEFYSRPSQVDLVDYAYNAQTGIVEITGVDVFPFVKYSLINQKTYSEFEEKFGLEQTIGDARRFWKSEFKKDNQQIFFPGEAGGVFGYTLNLDSFPKYQARPHLLSRTPVGTYKDNVRLFGRKQPNSEVSSDQNSVTNESDPTKFNWYFHATEANQYNRSELMIHYDGKLYKSYYEMYRGYANEISARLTGAPNGIGGITVLGEAAYNIWFEDFLWANSSEWAKQHWGLGAKYFDTLTPFYARNQSGTQVKTHLNSVNVDVKYRFKPGLWTRDETTGVMVSYQNTKYNDVTATVGGVGWFWARSMPRIIDDFFNLFPFMNYPKWVDMEVIYYPMNLKSDTTIGRNYAINFHGQVLWRPNFFGEAGFGVKRYDFNAPVPNATVAGTKNIADLLMVYGTVGLGYKF